MTYTSAEHDAGPIAFRYPRGNGTGVALPETPEKLEIGKGRVVRTGKTVAILSLGTRLAEALKAADTLEARGLSTRVIDLQIGRAHVCTPATNALLVCRLLLDKKHITTMQL